MLVAGDKAVDLLGVGLGWFGWAPDGEAAGVTGVATVRRPLVACEADDPTPPVTLVVLHDGQMVETFGGSSRALATADLGCRPLLTMLESYNAPLQ